MKHFKIIFGSTLVVLLMLVSASITEARAHDDAGKPDDNKGAEVSAEHRNTGSEDDDTDADEESTDESTDDSTENKGKGEATSSLHRSAVSTFVKTLLEVADREGGIGEQVREIAKAQEDSEEATTEAIVDTENRGKFKTFLIGTDYKNIGVIRSELAKSDKQIEKLKALVEKATTDEAKAELNTEIALLEASQKKVEDFVKAQESKFSLFGWFVKIFN
jgi:hypothetical protein